MGAILALIILVIALLGALQLIASPLHLVLWLIAGLALAILLGAAVPWTWPWERK